MPGITGFRPNMRGASLEFGADVLALTCKQLNIDLVNILYIALSSYDLRSPSGCLISVVLAAMEFCKLFLLVHISSSFLSDHSAHSASDAYARIFA